MVSRRKAFHFDLDEKKLKMYYPSTAVTSYKKAWTKIRTFMKTNEIEHTQYSGYESLHGMTYYQAFGIIENLQAALPWFEVCAQAATITEIGERHDALEHLKKHRKAAEFSLKL